MRIPISEITNGTRNGQRVWICDFRYSDFGKKPIRKVHPTMVIVKPNSETKKKIYYSSSHFVTEKGTVIAPYDNTGFRSFPGTPVAVFDNEVECREFHREQCREIVKGINEWAKSARERAEEIRTEAIKASE